MHWHAKVYVNVAAANAAWRTISLILAVQLHPRGWNGMVCTWCDDRGNIAPLDLRLETTAWRCRSVPTTGMRSTWPVSLNATTIFSSHQPASTLNSERAQRLAAQCIYTCVPDACWTSQQPTGHCMMNNTTQNHRMDGPSWPRACALLPCSRSTTTPPACTYPRDHFIISTAAMLCHIDAALPAHIGNRTAVYTVQYKLLQPSSYPAFHQATAA
mmetsp:Transcript_22243/g.56559  ORF Transcript_22243/g.56559 Transcript_22243/m.56559 type:complete len:214 (+) Transcript_22243:1793-2434(+)